MAVIIIGEVVIGGLFGYGAFTATDVSMAAASLAAYGVGLPAFVINKTFQPAFFASQRGGLVAKISFLMIIINVTGSLLLMPVLGHVGLALATGLASWVSVIIMGVILLREQRLTWLAFRGPLAVCVASAVMGVALALGLSALSALSYHIASSALLQLLILMMIGLVSYFAIAGMMRIIPPFLFRRGKA